MLKIAFLVVVIVTRIFQLDVFYVTAGTSSSQVKDADLKYYLYNKNASKEELTCGNYGANLDKESDIKMFFHGWGEDMDTFWYSATRTTYVSKGFNVITVDWSQHAQTEYQVAFERVPLVADCAARFIMRLSKSQKITLDKIHLIGHCLGAHVAGFAGKTVFSQLKEKIGRITGLDPSGPSFYGTKDNGCLAKDDGTNVDTIVTDSGPNGLGLNRSAGQVNFFPNGGIGPQPGCEHIPCSHNRAAVYFHESIVSKRMVGKKCDCYANYVNGKCKDNDVNTLGDSVNFELKGDFYLNTSSQTPFGLGDV